MGKYLDMIRQVEESGKPTEHVHLIAHHESPSDKPDTLPRMSGMSGSHPEDSSKIRGRKTKADAMVPPLSAGWLVVYRNSSRRLCGGCDDRENGTVASCLWENGSWMVRLTSGAALPLRVITSVGQTDPAGRIVAAWTTQDHGYDGHQQPLRRRTV